MKSIVAGEEKRMVGRGNLKENDVEQDLPCGLYTMKAFGKPLTARPK